MSKFLWVSGQLAEVQRFINVPMRWCEQYPARERRELWVTTADGQDIKLIVHSRLMPALRGHQVIGLLLGEQRAGIHNFTSGRQVSCIRSDPPLLWRRCDAAAIALLSVIGITALVMLAWATLLMGLPLVLLCAPLMVTARRPWRCRTPGQVDRAIEIAKRRACGQPQLRRVKQCSVNLCDRPAHATQSPPGCSRRARAIGTIVKATKHQHCGR